MSKYNSSSNKSENRNQKIEPPLEKEKYLFEVWKEYERVAMHFNDLIIRLRVQSLGGVAAISSLIAILPQIVKLQGINFGEFSIAVFSLVILFWLAIWVLDFNYYNLLFKVLSKQQLI